MTAAFPIKKCDPFDRARAEIFRWRGEMIDIFALAEAQVSETLLMMAKSSGAPINGVMLVGQRFSMLSDAVADGGSEAELGRHARGSIAKFRQHEKLRAALCHGVTRAAVDEAGDWVAILELIALKASGVERSTQALTAVQAATDMTELRRAERNLAGQLCKMRRDMAARDTATAADCGPEAALLQPAA